MAPDILMFAKIVSKETATPDFSVTRLELPNINPVVRVAEITPSLRSVAFSTVKLKLFSIRIFTGSLDVGL